MSARLYKQYYFEYIETLANDPNPITNENVERQHKKYINNITKFTDEEE